MKKKVILSIILVFALGIPLFAFLFNADYCRQIAKKQTTPGAYSFEDGQSPYFLNEYLSCEWEYYPDELIYSESEENLISGQINDLDPAVKADERRQHPNQPYTPPEYSTELNPDADHILLPAAMSLTKNAFSSTPRSASYRLVLKNCPLIEKVDMIIDFPGMIDGNYAVYINGSKRPNLVAPFSYAVYYTPLQSEMEIVVETSNAQIPLNICPRIAHKGTTMSAVDGYKYHFAAIAAALVIGSIILMILVFAVEPSKYRWHFGIGLIFSICFVTLNLWVSGFLGTITSVIPAFWLTRIPVILLLLGSFMIFFTLRRFHSALYPGKSIQICEILSLISTGLAIILNIFPGTVLATYTGLLALLLILAAFILWFIKTIQIKPEIPADLFLFQVGILSLFCGSVSAMIYTLFGLQNAFLYVYPFCLLVYLVLIFISSKHEQRNLVNNTLKLLELEKENTKFQAAALSSKLQPHFLYNTLTSIQEMCYTEPEMASEMIVHLSQYLRNNVDFMDYSDLIPFEQELKHIENYLFIQKARYGDSLNYEQFLGIRDFQLPPFTVQPLIENAINYGVRTNRNGGTVRLETYLENGIVHIKVGNSGKGFDTSKIKPNHSIMNIKKRLSYLADGDLTITSSPDGYGALAEITLPLKTKKNRNDEH